jgi:predicted XRE-type DNA-binding protein
MRRNFNLDVMLKRKKLRQEDLAAILKVSRSQVNHVVTGRWNLTKEEKRAYAAALKCRIKEIF